MPKRYLREIATILTISAAAVLGAAPHSQAGWSDAKVLNTYAFEDGGEAIVDQNPQMAASDDTVVAVWTADDVVQIARSLDEGDTWTDPVELTAGTNPYILYLGSDSWFLYFDGGSAASTDDGVTWSGISSFDGLVAGASRSGTIMKVTPVDGLQVSTSTDLGQTWSVGVPLPLDDVGQVVNTGGSNWLLFTSLIPVTDGLILFSSDNGASWSLLPERGFAYNEFGGAAADGEGRVVMAKTIADVHGTDGPFTVKTVLRTSSDFGATWSAETVIHTDTVSITGTEGWYTGYADVLRNENGVWTLLMRYIAFSSDTEAPAEARYFKVFAMQSYNGGASWTSPVEMAAERHSVFGADTFLDVTYAAIGKNVLFHWSDINLTVAGQPTGFDYDIIYSQLTGISAPSAAQDWQLFE